MYTLIQNQLTWAKTQLAETVILPMRISIL